MLLHAYNKENVSITSFPALEPCLSLWTNMDLCFSFLVLRHVSGENVFLMGSSHLPQTKHFHN